MEFLRDIYRNFSQLFVWWFFVAPWEQALRVRLGKYVSLCGPGVHLRIPIIDILYKQSIRLRVLSTPPQTLSTLDAKAITVAGQLSYEIVDLEELYRTVNDPMDVLMGACRSLISEYIIHNNLEDISAELLEKHVEGKLNVDQYGIQRHRFYLTNFASVKTYRFISGDLNNWNEGEQLDTITPEGPTENHQQLY